MTAGSIECVLALEEGLRSGVLHFTPDQSPASSRNLVSAEPTRSLILAPDVVLRRSREPWPFPTNCLLGASVVKGCSTTAIGFSTGHRGRLRRGFNWSAATSTAIGVSAGDSGAGDAEPLPHSERVVADGRDASDGVRLTRSSISSTRLRGSPMNRWAMVRVSRTARRTPKVPAGIAGRGYLCRRQGSAGASTNWANTYRHGMTAMMITTQRMIPVCLLVAASRSWFDQ